MYESQIKEVDGYIKKTRVFIAATFVIMLVPLWNIFSTQYTGLRIINAALLVYALYAVDKMRSSLKELRSIRESYEDLDLQMKKASESPHDLI